MTIFDVDGVLDNLLDIICYTRDALEGERRSKLKRRSAAKKAEFTRRKPSLANAVSYVR